MKELLPLFPVIPIPLIAAACKQLDLGTQPPSKTGATYDGTTLTLTMSKRLNARAESTGSSGFTPAVTPAATDFAKELKLTQITGIDG